MRLGLPLCAAHYCKCGELIETNGAHAFKCRQNNSRIVRHTGANDVVQRALNMIRLPSRLEPNHLEGSNGKRPDGITLLPYNRGKYLAWDFTCPHSLGISYINNRVNALAKAEETKRKKYSFLDDDYYIFEPIAIDTLCAPGKSTSKFLSAICKRIRTTKNMNEEGQYFIQRLCVAIIKGNTNVLNFSLF